MSYAQAAAKGPKQSPEEVSHTSAEIDGRVANEAQARAPQPTQIDDSSSSFSEVDGEHLKTEASETYEETAQKTSEATEKTKEKSSDYLQTAREKASEASKYSKEKGSEFADQAGDKYDHAKKRAATNAKEAKKEIKSAGQDISDNRDNPVYVANGVLLVVGSAALGYGAYTKHVKGELDWQLAGLTAAAMGVLAVGDYYLSQYLFKNKYPKK